MATPKRPRGRPPLDPGDRSTCLQVRIPSKEFDAACHVAHVRRVTLSEFLRAAVRRAIREGVTTDADE